MPVIFELVLLLMLGISTPPVTGGGFKDVAHILKASITEDSTVEACDDFYGYACGKYMKDNPTGSTIIASLDKEMYEYLSQVLNSSEPVEGMPEQVLHVLRETYSQCRNQEHLEWAKEVDEVITELGGMPMFTGHTCTYKPTEFATFLAHTHKMNMLYYRDRKQASPAMFTPVLEMNSGFKPQNIVNILVQIPNYMQQDKGERRRYYASVLQYYRQGIDPLATVNENDPSIKLMLNFEDALFEDVEKEEARRKRIQVTYETLEGWLEDHFDADAYFKTLLPEKKTYFEKHPDSLIRTYNRYYLEERIADVFTILGNCEVKYNYALFKLIESSYVVHEETMRSCVAALVSSPLKQALAALYMHTKLENRRSPGLKDMTHWINQALQKMIEDANWIENETTREFALKKAMEMNAQTGVPNLFNEKNLAAFYGHLPFDPNEGYYENRREMSKWFMDWMMARIGQSDPLCVFDHWYKDNALQINAFYFRRSNQLVINPALSQPPFYQENYPMFYKYGILGFTIGHEMTHGFDIYGRRYDERGSFYNWWDETTDKEYLKKAQCFVDQYNKTYMKDLKVPINGKITLHEDIADNGGIRAAFKGYKLWKKYINKNVEEKHLPILGSLGDLTPDRLFFISAAYKRCQAETKQETREWIKNGEWGPS